MPLPLFLFQLFPQLSWICAATPGVQMVEGGGEQTLAITAYSGFHTSRNWPEKYHCKQACFPFIKDIFFFFLPSFWVRVRKRRHAATTGMMSASPGAPQLRGWGLYANVAVTKSNGNMNSTQMCMYPCGKVRRKRPVRFVEAHSLQCTHMSKHAAFGLDPARTGEGTHWELPITQTSRKSRPQPVQWLVGVGDTARRGGWGRGKMPFQSTGQSTDNNKITFSPWCVLCAAGFHGCFYEKRQCLPSCPHGFPTKTF